MFKEREYKERMNGKQWVLDSRASYHMTSELDMLTNLFKFPEAMKILGPNGKVALTKELGTIDLGSELILEHVLYPNFYLQPNICALVDEG